MTKRLARIELFYADWCGHSNAFLPVWEELKNVLVGYCSEYEYTQYEASKQLNIFENIKAFPTIRFYYFINKKVNHEEYFGERTCDAISHYVFSNFFIPQKILSRMKQFLSKKNKENANDQNNDNIEYSEQLIDNNIDADDDDFSGVIIDL